MTRITLTPFLSSLGMVRFAQGSHDSFDCTGEESIRPGRPRSPVLQWKKACRRVQLTAIFLHLRATQLVTNEAAYVVGVDAPLLYIWKQKYSECSRLWDEQSLVMSLYPKFDIKRFMPNKKHFA